MNVELENLPNCITTMRVEVPADKVTKAWEKTAREYAQHAKLPGYRPGKAPRAVVEAKFKKEIKEEVQNRLLSESYREAIQEKKLRVVSLTDIEEVDFGSDKPLRFTATLVTAPEFELPEYKALAVELPSVEVTDGDIDATLEHLREQSADFVDIAGRPLQMDDFAVVTYTGTIDGQPVHEAVPAAGKALSGNTDFWIRMTPDSLITGFAQALVGAAAGESREFDIDVPADFAISSLAGHKIHYAVTVNTLKEKVLPLVDDAFADKVAPGKTLAEVRELVRAERLRQKTMEVEQEKRSQIMSQLLAKVECELPESMVHSETRRMLSEIVRDNQSRGVPDDLLKEKHEELIAAATQSARDRVKGTFILVRIAESEKISVSREEVDRRIVTMSAHYGMTPEKLRKELEKADSFGKLSEEILTGKVLDFLASSVSVPASASQPAPVAG